jgi:multiple sugar transport system permease protein
VLSVTIVTLIWRFVLAPDAGLLGETAQALGAEPIPFLSHPTWSLWALALTTIWWSIGPAHDAVLAGLQQDTRRRVRGRALDRASRWTTLLRVTLPALSARWCLS